MSERLAVLVVGAGPVGLSAALSLARLGVPVRVIDSGDDIDRRMRASTFHPPTLDIIESLGLADDLLADGLKAPQFQLRQHESGEFVSFDLEAIRGDTKHPYRLQVEQHRYCELLVQALSVQGVDVEFATRLDTVEQDDERVAASTSAGAVECDWLIGADGAGSAVRGAIGLEYGGMTHTHSSVLVSVDFPFHEALDELDNVNYCWSGRGPFSLLRLSSFWRASLYPGVEDLNAAADETRVRDWLAFIHPDARDANIRDINPYRVHERCVDRFRVGRVLLAGDAAHLNPPSGGMGMNGGIHDAMNLTGKLLRVISGADDSLLDVYDRQRQTLASQRIIPQASANRARMATTDLDAQRDKLEHYRAIAADEQRCRDYLLQASMITGLREAMNIE